MTPGELSRIEDTLRRAYGDVLESVRREGSSPEPHRSAHYVATTASDQGQPAGVRGCRPSMTGTARPREVWPRRMSGSDERAAIPRSET
jgi:hypothetical protein